MSTFDCALASRILTINRKGAKGGGRCQDPSGYREGVVRCISSSQVGPWWGYRAHRPLRGRFILHLFSPPLTVPQEYKDVKERIQGLRPQLYRLKQVITTTTIDGDPEETDRRSQLTRYAPRLSALPALANDLFSALAEIERRSQELLAKGTTVRFLDKAGDSGEVTKLIERLREAITHYQASENCLLRQI